MFIEYIKFKNFNSFGKEEVTLSFKDLTGLTLLYGDNGAGKSTLAEVITFCLYGKTPNKKRIENHINRYIKNELETEIQFIAKNRVVNIKRNIKPTFFEVTVDSVKIDYAYKKNIQKYLENEILGIPYEIFNNIISISISDFKSFTKRVSIKDKQEIIDKLFGLEFIVQMYNLNKNYISQKRTDSTLINKSIDELQLVLSETNSKIKELKRESKEQKNFQINEYKNVYDELVINIQEIQKELNVYKEKEQLLTKHLNENKQIFNTLNHEIKNLEKDIKLYTNNQCPLCKSNLHTIEHQQRLNTLIKQKEEYNKKVNEFKKFENEITIRINEYTQKTNEINSNINNKNNKLIKIKTLLQELNKTDDDIEINGLISIINNTNKKIENYQKSLNELTDELYILRIVNEVLNENGVKRIMLSRIIPAFNKEIKSILNNLGINFKVLIDDKFNTTIIYLGEDVPIDTLSTGQLKKIDLAIILTFIKILKTKFSNLNILFLDEIFASLDIEGVYGVLNILKDMANEYNFNVITVNHSEMPTVELFSNKINTKVKDNFSYIEIEKVK